MAMIECCSGEEILVGAHGSELVRLVVADPAFGPIATVRLDHRQAALFANALDEQLAALKRLGCPGRSHPPSWSG